MFEDIVLNDLVNVIAFLAVAAILLYGFMEGKKRFGETNKTGKEKVIDFIFGFDMFLAIWWGASFAAAAAAGFGAIIVLILFPPVALIACAVAFCLPAAMNYRYNLLGFSVVALAASIMFIDGIITYASDIFGYLGF